VRLPGLLPAGLGAVKRKRRKMKKVQQRRRVPRDIERKIRAVLKVASMDESSFGMPQQTITFSGGFGEDPRTEDVTEFIRERTREWRASWVEGPLRQVLQWIETGKLPEY
jgi:hypothetical protein